MSKPSIPGFSYSAKAYCLLTKPGIIMGNIINTIGGFLLASKIHFSPVLLLATLIGLACVIASACVCNNYIDREIDAKMERTKNRPSVQGIIPARNAISFALILLFAGIITLGFLTNWLTLSIALLGFAVYVGLYSFSKYHSVHGTLIGSVAGAIPPLVGYCSASGQIDLGGGILFLLLALWQMPHFFAISMFRMDEYQSAQIPILPITKGITATKVQMACYILAFTATATLLTISGYTSLLFLGIMTSLGLAWLGFALFGFIAKDDQRWARQMFIISLIVVMAINISIPL